MKIWDVKNRRETEISQQSYQERVQVSSVCWLTRRNETFDTLCYGNALGFMVFLQYDPTEVSISIDNSVLAVLTKKASCDLRPYIRPELGRGVRYCLL